MATNKTVNFYNPDMKDVIINMVEEKSVKNKSLNWLPVGSCFTGREDILKKIKEEFTNKKCVVLYGMPGIGKTETARQFGSRNCDSFNGNLIWIFSETSDNIKECFDKLATSLDLKITDASQIFNQFKTSKVLIIFDNAECMTTIKNYLPSNQLHPTVHVLITSRLSNWGSSTSLSKIPLNSLNTEDALSIFKQKLGHKFEEYEQEKWEELVQKLDGIPLCLQIVSSLTQQQVHRIRLTKFNLGHFINELEVKLISSTTPDSEQDYYQKSVLVAINSVLSRFEEAKATSSLDLLCFIAYLHADWIHDDNLFLIPSILKSKHQLEEAINNLNDYSLIQTAKVPYSSRIKIKVHRTVQLVLRDYDLKNRNGDMFKTLLRLSLSHEIYMNETSIFQYASKMEFLEKTREFYNKNHENESLIEKYVWKLVKYNCDEALQIILPEFKNERTEKFIELLFFQIYCEPDSKITEMLIKIIAQNEEIGESSWRSTKFIDILLASSISKNSENVSEYKMNLKNSVTGRFLHLLVKQSNKKNARETIECMSHLISKWDGNISYQDDYLDTLIHIACRNSKISLEIIEYLFQFENEKLKRMVNCQNKDKKTPLYYLFQKNNSNLDQFEIFRCFITQCWADITIKDEDGWNILFSICWNGSFEMIEFLLKDRDCSKIINDQDTWGDVAFSGIILNSSIKEVDKIELFNLFLKYKMDISLKNKENKTLLEIAEGRGLNALTKVINNNLKELEPKASKRMKR